MPMPITRPSVEEMADALAAWVADGAQAPLAEDRRRAAEALDAIGVPALLADLALAERILEVGNAFHTIAGFFVEGCAERVYLRALNPSPPAAP